MKEQRVKKHVRESIPLVKAQIEQLKVDIEVMKPTVDIVNIGKYIKMQIDLIRLEEKLVRMLEEVGE